MYYLRATLTENGVSTLLRQPGSFLNLHLPIMLTVFLVGQVREFFCFFVSCCLHREVVKRDVFQRLFHGTDSSVSVMIFFTFILSMDVFQLSVWCTELETIGGRVWFCSISVWRTPACAGSVFISLNSIVIFIHACTISIEFAGNEPVALAQGHRIRQHRQPPVIAAPSVALHARHIVPAQVPTAGGGRLRHAARFPGRDAVA